MFRLVIRVCSFICLVISWKIFFSGLVSECHSYQLYSAFLFKKLDKCSLRLWFLQADIGREYVCACVWVCVWEKASSCQLTFRGLPISTSLQQTAMWTNKSQRILRWGCFIECLMHCWRKTSKVDETHKISSERQQLTRGEGAEGQLSTAPGQYLERSAGLFDGRAQHDMSLPLWFNEPVRGVIQSFAFIQLLCFCQTSAKN